ncbi:MAG: sulfite exporter TauE/SafE family protein [Terriglobales bacterium]
MTYWTPVFAGFLLGLSTGPLCLGTCLPVVFPFAVGEISGDTARKRWGFLGEFLAGRLLAYLFTGLVVGALSHRFAYAGSRMGVYAWLVLSLVLLVYGVAGRPQHAGICPWVSRLVRRRAFAFLLGMLTGLSVCPPFLLALGYVLERSSNALFGLLFFLAFFCATTMFILPLGVLGHVPRQAWMEQIGRWAAILAGGYFLCDALLSLLRMG